ncbi:hypothetical protein Hypma_000053 [Hypsizygus marmoreus]|uniref:Uncharacterized protein n=1 Tax=Hypsizygus marmoreus TaxID=39966 RepID=A0A369KJE8_HYPMA|nr:hypothetical protein Hypma_000053 [Hypsizygus marmoreus]
MTQRSSPVYGANVGMWDTVTAPFAEEVAKFRSNPLFGDMFMSLNGQDEISRYMQSNILRGRADDLKATKKYAQASAMYLQAARLVTGEPLPVKTAHSKAYGDLTVWQTIELASCFNGAAICMLESKRYEGALMWLAECDVLIQNSRRMIKPATFFWIDLAIQVPEFIVQKTLTDVITANVYLELGNTGAATARRWYGMTSINTLPDSLRIPAEQILPTAKVNELIHLKHPDPKLVPSINIKCDRLQVCGSWKKINIKKPGGVTARTGSAYFVYDSHLYILGGEKNAGGPFFREFWRLNLEKMDQWQRLPDYPKSREVTGELCYFSMAVSSDAKAYLFIGTPVIDFYDIKAQKWDSLMGAFTSKDGAVVAHEWPLTTMHLVDYAMHCVNDRLYIFGGAHMKSNLGCNLFLELDIATRKWRRLSGQLVPKTPDYEGPGPRHFVSSWVGKDQNRIFVMYGDADRQAAKRKNEAHGGTFSVAYDDLWSWDIKRGKWNREKMLGNIPSQRTEMACTYNRKLDKVVVFGGYSPTVPTGYPNQRASCAFSYYADTFIASDAEPEYGPTSSGVASPKWKQVLTRGYPTYRAQARLFCDEKTGKTFLFSGYTNMEFIHCGEEPLMKTRTFVDLWQLRMDVPGGFFEGVDMEEEARTAKAGPWQRCFFCGSAGQWKKCGGTCGGRAFFCNSQCLKDGWKEHKTSHNCRKAT